ncbi:MAG: polysaccharide deacetylase family protein [Lachnospiraceae bacterium]|nr:polysaccharide deacetylase family protein [Lachnospiraceae bacterium]MBR4083686.1 polysaccharide deacetylase family protein [Lachnospiraceae bacterium]
MNISSGQSIKKAITFSYDDGVTQDIRLIELLNKYGLKCTFNLNSNLFGTNNILHHHGLRIAQYRIALPDIKYVYEGHEVAVHTLTHPMLPKLEKDDIIYQIEEDRKNLEEIVGYDVVGMAYPGGGGGPNNDDRVAQIIKENTKIKYCRTTATTANFELQENLYRFNSSEYHLNWDRMMELGKQFVEMKADKPQIFYIWGHSYEMEYDSRNWVRLENFFEMISGRDDIFYGTNREVLL